VLGEPELELAAATGNGHGTGVAAPGRTRGAIRAATPPGASDLAARVRSTLAFFGSRSGAAPLTRVFVTGAGAAVEGVMAALTAAIDTPMTIVSAGDVVSVVTLPPAGDVSLNLVGTIGIALGEAGR
jgi:type IV pilus assembly protein PilM